MADYPTLPIGLAVTPDFSDPEIDFGGDGFARARYFHDDRRRWQVVHPVLNATQRATLDAHYTANRTAAFAFRDPNDGITYTVIYTKRPRYQNANARAASLRTAIVNLAESQ